MPRREQQTGHACMEVVVVEHEVGEPQAWRAGGTRGCPARGGGIQWLLPHTCTRASATHSPSPCVRAPMEEARGSTHREPRGVQGAPVSHASYHTLEK